MLIECHADVNDRWLTSACDYESLLVVSCTEYVQIARAYPLFSEGKKREKSFCCKYL